MRREFAKDRLSELLWIAKVRRDRESWNVALELLFELLAEDETAMPEVVSELTYFAVATRDSRLLARLLASAAEGLPFERGIISDCAVSQWRTGYVLFKSHFPGIEHLPGQSLLGAFMMADPRSFPPLVGPKTYIIASVVEFFALCRDHGLPNDEAIDFLGVVGLSWAIDAALGLPRRLESPED